LWHWGLKVLTQGHTFARQSLFLLSHSTFFVRDFFQDRSLILFEARIGFKLRSSWSLPPE
jgi:hypothetical protein